MEDSTTIDINSLESVKRNTAKLHSSGSGNPNYASEGNAPADANSSKSILMPIVQHYFQSAQKPIFEIGELGEGAYSYVFRGKSKHYGNGDGVAIKIMKPSQGSQDKSLVDMFRKGARIHHGISWNPFNLLLRRVPLVYESGSISDDYSSQANHGAQASGLCYMVVEHIKGMDFSKKLDHPKTKLSEIKQIARQLAEALFVVHDAGYVHRDIKPANVLECEKKGIMITDFGLAVKSGEHTLSPAGTPRYIAPEAMIPGELKPSADIFSFGVSIYEAIEKFHPFAVSPNQAMGVLQAIRQNPARKMENEEALDSGLAKVIMKCLEKEQHRRYKTGFELLNALDRL